MEHDIKFTVSFGPQIHQNIADAGSKVLTRTILHTGEAAWWKSAVGKTHELARTQDVGKMAIDDVHGKGMKFIGYFRFMSDEYIEKTKPEWISRDHKGHEVIEPRTKGWKRGQLHVICVNTPYRDFVRIRLEELAKRGCDIIYFDSWHMPPVCTCDWCRNKYEKETGKPFPLLTEKKKAGLVMEYTDDFEDYQIGQPPLASVAKLHSADYLSVSAFIARSLVEVFTYWRNAVLKINPDIRFAIGSSLYPMFIGQPQLSGDFIAIADTSKTEFNKPFGGDPESGHGGDLSKLPDFAEPAFDLQVATGWSLVRDSTSGRPPLMWVPDIRREKEALYSSAAVVTYGCIASLAFRGREYVQEGNKRVPVYPGDQQPVFKSSYEWGNKVSPHLAHKRPVPWAVVHISEEIRNQRLDDKAALWVDLISPVLGAIRTLKEAHLPWTTITDRQVMAGLLPETKVLIVPKWDELSPALRKAIDNAAKQVTVISTDDMKDWHKRASSTVNAKALLNKLQDVQAKHPPMVTVKGSKDAHVVYYAEPGKKTTVIMICNSFGWFKAIRQKPGIKPESHPEFIDNVKEPPILTDLVVQVNSSYGAIKTVTEAATGKKLPFKKSPNGYTIQLPEFQISACIIIE